MRKILLFILALIASGPLCLKQLTVSEGWVDDDTYRVTGTGIAGPRAKDAADKEKDACWAAIITAQSRIIKKFAQTGSKKVQGTIRSDYLSPRFTEHGSGMISGGKVIRKKFDPATDSCEIVYEIHEKDLRKKAQQITE